MKVNLQLSRLICVGAGCHNHRSQVHCWPTHIGASLDIEKQGVYRLVNITL